MPDTGIYVRISDDRHDGAGIERQLEDGWRLVRKYGWDAEEFPDNHISASRFSKKPRPQYKRLLEAVKSGDIKRIVCYKTDRLYRQPLELEELITLADQGRVEIKTVEGSEIDLSTSEGRMFARLLCAYSAHESDVKSDRVSRQQAQARSRGSYTGSRIPFGWRQESKGEDLIPDPEQARLLNDAVDAILQGASLSDIARQWHKLGIKRPYSLKANWTAHRVAQVIRLPRHAGLIGHRDRDKVSGKYAQWPTVIGKASWNPIIDPEKWLSINNLLEYRAVHYRVPKRRSLLTGLLVCGNCNTTMVRSSYKGGVKIWRCNRNNGGCAGVSIASSVESILVEATLRLAPVALTKLATETNHEDETAAIYTKLKELEDRDSQLSDSFANGRINIKSYEAASTALEKQVAKLNDQLSKITHGNLLSPYSNDPDLLRSKWDSFHMDQQRAVIKEILGRIVVLPRNGHRGNVLDINRLKPERFEELQPPSKLAQPEPDSDTI